MKTLRLLLVEDEPDVLITIAEMLARRGFIVQTAIDGEDALRGGKLMSADIVVSDIRMPRMDGIELYRRASAVRPDLPFIFMSGHIFEIREHSFLCGSLQPVLIHKPFAAEDLIAAVDRQFALARRLNPS